jgi:DNA-binding transcriptional regulator YdaS (Cro superfamily)
MSTVRALVRELGGGRAVADRLGISQSAVSQWVTYDRIPPSRLLSMWKFAAEKGVAWKPPEAAGLTLGEAA